MIISASRRTDIPAFYAEWFINRIRAGFLLTRNPFNYRQISRVSLLPEEAEVIVFWTRNPRKLMPYLPELRQLGHRFYFQYTLTGYPRVLEEKTVSPYKSIETFRALSQAIGSDSVIWRYDPILLSNLLPLHEHIRLFTKLAQSLRGYTRRVVISFVDFYKKTEKNLNAVSGLSYQDILQQESAYTTLAQALAEIAARCGMEIFTCAENVQLAQFGIQPGKCIDDRLIKQLFSIDVSRVKDAGQREACGCVKSIDIGAYNTCLHGCTYCYATFNHALAAANYKKHDPQSPFLLGPAQAIPVHLLQAPERQTPLF